MFFEKWVSKDICRKNSDVFQAKMGELDGLTVLVTINIPTFLSDFTFGLEKTGEKTT